MKSSSKITFIILGIVFALSTTIKNDFNFNLGNNNNISEYDININFDNENLKNSKISGKIHINGNSGWSDAKTAGICTGSGTYSDPYVIKDLVIGDENPGDGIWIENSDVHFKIENVVIYDLGWWGDDTGIVLSHVSNSQLINNNFSLNNRGIYLSYSNNITISGNIINANYWEGIYLSYSNNIIISGNTIDENYWGGIDIDYSNNNTISGNTVTDSTWGFGISLYDCDNSIVSGNSANNNRGQTIILKQGNNNTISGNIIYNEDHGDIYGGILIGFSDNNNIIGNKVSSIEDGIFLNYADNNTISTNSLNNNEYGIYLYDSSNNNTISENILEYNINNAYQSLNTYINHWDNGMLGNYWSDYSGKDTNDDGIGDSPYIIDPKGSFDNYPIWWDPPIFHIISPLMDESFGKNAPEYSISIDEGIPYEMWYIIEGVDGNFYFTDLNGTIPQDTWNELPEKEITINFYVKDKEGKIKNESIVVIKSGSTIPGYELLFLIGVICITSMISLKRLKKSNKLEI